MSPYTRLLYLQALDWLENSEMLVEKKLVSQVNALYCVRELVEAGKFGPRTIVDIEEAIVGQGGNDDTMLDVDGMMETVIMGIEERNNRMAKAIKVLFEEIPPGTVVVGKKGLEPPGPEVLVPLQQLRPLLDRFLEKDASRSGGVTLDEFCQVVLEYWLLPGGAFEGEEEEKCHAHMPTELTKDQLKVSHESRTHTGVLGFIYGYWLQEVVV